MLPCISLTASPVFGMPSLPCENHPALGNMRARAGNRMSEQQQEKSLSFLSFQRLAPNPSIPYLKESGTAKHSKEEKQMPSILVLKRRKKLFELIHTDVYVHIYAYIHISCTHTKLDIFI